MSACDKLFGFHVEISHAVPPGEIWLVDPDTGEITAKIVNIGEDPRASA